MILSDCIKAKKFLSLLDKNNDLSGKTIFLVTVRNFSLVLHQELFIANILARMGAKVYYLLDDGILPHWDTRQVHQQNLLDNPRQRIHNRSVEFILSNTYKHKNIHKLYISDYISDIDVENELTRLETYDVNNCISSVRRFFECGKFDKENNKHLEYYKKCLKNSAIMKVAVRNVIEDIKPDIAISSHGIYSVWGSAYNVLKNEKDIPVYIYGAHAYSKDGVLFTDSLCQTLTKDSDAIEFMKKGEFGSKEYEKISNYFRDRRLHTTKDTAIYYSWIDKENNRKLINKKQDHIATFCLFTNIIWDGDVTQRDTIFNGMLENTIYTINKFRELPYELYVRIHPAEATLWKNSLKMGEIIRNEIPDINNIQNVHIIDSNEPIDTYKFVQDNIDIALVYDGILSLELTAIGCPVIATAVTRYANGDYVISPKSINEYNHYLENPELCKNFLTEEKINKMHKFAYWFIYKAGYTFPLYDENHFSKLNFSNKNYSKIKSESFRCFINKLKRSVNGN